MTPHMTAGHCYGQKVPAIYHSLICLSGTIPALGSASLHSSTVDCRLTVWPSPAGFPAPWVASLTQDPLPRKPTLFHAAFLVLYNRSYPGSKPSILIPSDLQWLLYLPSFLKLQSSTCCPQSVLTCFEWFSQSAYILTATTLTYWSF